MRSRRLAWVLVWSLLAGFACAGGQASGQSTDAAAISPATEAALRDMVQLAGVIFTGEVVAVRLHDSTDGSAGVVEIKFAVNDAIRGASGGSYTLREWAGLWAAGDPPFRVGQRYLMLLHAPGASGLSSPVGGTDGAIPIRGGTAVDLRTVDLRWIATRAVQPVAYRAASAAHTTALPVSAPSSLDDATAAAAGSSQQAAYSAVITLLRSWEKDDAASR